MKVLVCGSRSFDDRVKVFERFSKLPQDTLIISGGADGADSLAELAAMEYHFPINVVKPDWEKHGRAAGPIRNIQMLDMNPDLVIAFYDGVSRGTAHTIKEATKRNIAVEIIK